MLTGKQAAADLMQVRQLISNLIATTQDTEARQELTRTLSAMTDPLMAIYDPQTPSTMQDWGTLNDQLNALDSMDTEQTLGFISTLSHSLMHLMNNTGLQNYKAHECTTGAAILIYDIKEKLEAKVANSQFTASDIERLMQLENVQKCGWDSDTLKGKIADSLLCEIIGLSLSSITTSLYIVGSTLLIRVTKRNKSEFPNAIHLFISA